MRGQPESTKSIFVFDDLLIRHTPSSPQGEGFAKTNLSAAHPLTNLRALMSFPYSCHFEPYAVYDNGSFILSEEHAVLSWKINRLRNLTLDQWPQHNGPRRPCSSKPARDRKPKRLEKLSLDSVCDRFKAVMGVQFLIDMVQMVAKGLRRNLQLPCDRRGVLAHRKQA